MNFIAGFFLRPCIAVLEGSSGFGDCAGENAKCVNGVGRNVETRSLVKGTTHAGNVPTHHRWQLGADGRGNATAVA